jgi:hypothetical protein
LESRTTLAPAIFSARQSAGKRRVVIHPDHPLEPPPAWSEREAAKLMREDGGRLCGKSPSHGPGLAVGARGSLAEGVQTLAVNLNRRKPNWFPWAGKKKPRSTGFTEDGEQSDMDHETNAELPQPVIYKIRRKGAGTPSGRRAADTFVGRHMKEQAAKLGAN